MSPSPKGQEHNTSQAQGMDQQSPSGLLPKIGVSEASKKLGISSVDGSTLMSRRERKYKFTNSREKLIGFDYQAHSKKRSKNFLMESHHYKYNRIKDGGWGAVKDQSEASTRDG